MKPIIDEMGVRTEASDSDEITIKHAVSFTHDIIVDGSMRVSSLRTLDGAMYGTGSLASYDVVSYAPAGTARDGAVDWTAYIQATIDAATGNADPATISRIPKAAVYIPAGIYKITAPIVIRSVQGFHLFGDGPWLTRLSIANNLDLDSLLELDGVAWGVFENFSLESSAAGRADKMLHLHWSAAAARSTTSNTFRNIVVSGRFRTAFAVGVVAGELGIQVDQSTFSDCIVIGQWDDGEITDWQNAWEVGNDTHGNNVDHVLFAPGWTHVRYGIYVDASSVMAYGVHGGWAEVHFYVLGTGGPFVVDGMRMESGRRLLYVSSGASVARVSLSNIDYTADYLNADGRWVYFSVGGSLRLTNITLMYAPVGVTPNVYLNAPGTLTTCIAQGVSTPTAFSGSFVRSENVTLTVMNYQQLANNIPIAVTPMSIVGPGGLNWTPS